MPLTAMDPMPALVLVDFQKRVLDYDAAHPIGEVLRQASELAAAFRRHGLPVVLVNVIGGAPGRTEAKKDAGSGGVPRPDWAEICDELDPRPGDLRVTKQRWGAFHGTPLHALLQDLGVTQVVLGGVRTSIGVESTARAAYEHGYNVVLATDAMTDLDGAAHGNSVERIFPRLGETAHTANVIEMLDRTR